MGKESEQMVKNFYEIKGRWEKMQEVIKEKMQFFTDEQKATIQAAQDKCIASRDALEPLNKKKQQIEKNKIKVTEEEKKQAMEEQKIQEEIVQEDRKQADEVIKGYIDVLDLHTQIENDPETAKLLFASTLINSIGPKPLAQEWADNPGSKEEFEELLDDLDTLKEFIAHGPAKKQQYVKAYQLWKQLFCIVEEEEDQSTPKNQEMYDCHRRLAMAIALEHADGIKVFDSDVVIDPIARYRHYVEAHRSGELDPAFSYLSTWEYRHVVDSDAADEELKWARDHLKRYRPNQVATADCQWRYAVSVRTDVGYRVPNWTASPRTYKQLVSGGGKCGPRAWYGRMMCKAFGTPSWGVKQPGHAACGRWTPGGWETILGAGWNHSYWDNRPGTDHVAECNARAHTLHSIKPSEYSLDIDEYYQKVILVECVGAAIADERIMFWEKTTRQYPAKYFWRSVAGAFRRHLSSKCDVKTMHRREPKDGEEPIVETQLDLYLKRDDKPESDNEVIIEEDTGVITIPGCAFLKKHKKVELYRSFGGGAQALMSDKSHYLEYDFPDYATPKEGCDYEISVKVCNVHLQQFPLNIEISTNKENVCQSEVPYTVGEWGFTEPVCIGKLEQDSMIKISREKCFFGLVIKSIILTPC